MKSSAYSLTSNDWLTVFQNMGQSPHTLKYWLDGLYKDQKSWQKHISPAFLENIKNSFDFKLPQIAEVQESHDNTVKFLVRFADGMEVETVIIPFHKRFTICLSTQVGCGMNCSFCYTGTQGLKRNLTSGEIVGQYLLAYQWLKQRDRKVVKPALVFMGQGEPLHNCEAVEQSIKVFHDPKTIGVGNRQMTLSTVGYIPGMEKLSEFSRINIALSLHSPFQAERIKLIPLSVKYPLNEVLLNLDKIPLLSKQFITFEYLLVKDFNMGDEHVQELHRLLSHRKAILNLIPFNPFPGAQWQRPTKTEIDGFKAKLVEKKLRVMIRSTKGDDILAACGQLKVNKLARISK